MGLTNYLILRNTYPKSSSERLELKGNSVISEDIVKDKL